MGSHEMHFPLGHHLPLGSLTTAPVLGVWEGLGEFGASCTPQRTLPSAFPLLHIKAEPPVLPWLLHAASCSSSINTTGKSISFTALIDVLL